MQTQDRIDTAATPPPPSKRPRWLVPALAGATAVIAAIIIVALVFTGNDEPDVIQPAPVETTVATPTTLPASGPETRPTTPVSAALDEAYYVRASGEFDAEAMGIEPGTVSAEWYRADGFYVVFFEGLDTIPADSLCPGAYVEGAGPDFMSFAPIGSEDCTGHGPSTRRVSEGARPLQCENSLAYRTFIPEGTEGTLFAVIDKTVGEGIMGITSMVDSSTGAIPEVDLSLLEC